ncbi:MAG TPA: hypothetical protein DHW64_04400 [Chitinophagaceae bacterium]|nr:hypothetical protein [Chitinophagaceae bacterium]
MFIYQRRKSIGQLFLPFAVFSCVAFLGEMTLRIVIASGQRSAVYANCYVLIEFPIFLWMYYTWSSRKNALLFVGLFLVGLFVWIYDNFILNSITITTSIYRIYYSLVLILCSINQTNKILFSDHGSLWKNTIFMVSTVSIVYYSFRVFIESMFLFQAEMSNEFMLDVFMIMKFVNFFAHLVYTLAVLCIPARKEFTLRY